MKLKRFFIFSSTLFCIAIVVFGAMFLFKNNPPKSIENQEAIEKKELIPSSTTEVYKDESGFTFSYPDNLSVVKKDVSNSIYANIAVTAKSIPGSITLVAEDTKIKSIQAWISENIPFSMSATGSANTKEVKLGELEAKEVMNGSNTITTVALDQGILFKIVVLLENEPEYWKSAYKTILSSFSFVQPEPTSNSNASLSNQDSSGDDVVLEEEFVE